MNYKLIHREFDSASHGTRQDGMPTKGRFADFPTRFIHSIHRALFVSKSLSTKAISRVVIVRPFLGMVQAFSAAVLNHSRLLLWRMVAVIAIVSAGMTGNIFAQDQAVPPPSAPAQLSEDQLETLVAPIALYPDPLLTVMLPASVYPLEIVQAARFVQNSNNLSQIDAQPWDDNVKAVAKYPTVIQKMNDDLQWTIQLGNAFADQPMDLMNAIQTLRAKAQAVGTLKTTPEQIIIVTNAVVERTYQEQIVYVTNTVIEIQPANPQYVYVPVYNPVYVYYPPPGYIYYPTFPVYYPIVITPYRCNWYYGGIYIGGGGWVVWGGRGPYHPPYYPLPPGYYRPPAYRPPPGYRPPPPGHRPPGYPPPGSRPPGKPPGGGPPGNPGNRPPGGNPPGNPGNRPPGGGQPGNPGNRPPSGGPTIQPVPSKPGEVTIQPVDERWQPDPNRRRNSGSGGNGDTGPSRGWPSNPSTQPAPGNPNGGNRPGNGTGGGTRPGNGNRPNTGNGGNNSPSIQPMPSNPNPGNGGGGNRTGGGNRPNPGNGGNNSPTIQPMPSNPGNGGGNRPSQPSGGSRDSAFGGVGSGNDARNSSNRGSSSRGGGGGGGGGGR